LAVLVATATLAWAAPAQGASYAYVASLGGTLSQYSLGPAGALMPLSQPTVNVGGRPASVGDAHLQYE
jgi:hypothetical protein